MQTSDLACFWRTGRGRGRKRRRCRKWCPASATTPTWCPRTARWPASGRECVSEPPPTSQSHSVGSNYPSYTSTLSSSLLADVLRFDNTYSIFQAKRLSFTVEVLLPDSMQSPKANGGVQEPTSSWDQQQQSSTLLIMWPNLFKIFNVFTFSPLYERRFRPQEEKKIQVTIHYYRKEIFLKLRFWVLSGNSRIKVEVNRKRKSSIRLMRRTFWLYSRHFHFNPELFLLFLIFFFYVILKNSTLTTKFQL